MSWVATILTLADHLAAHPTASHAAMDAEQHQQPLPKGATHKMDLAKYCYHLLPHGLVPSILQNVPLLMLSCVSMFVFSAVGSLEIMLQILNP